jgi:hypothetical protein
VLNLLLVKLGTEPGLESIPTIIKCLNPNIRTFGVVGSPDQKNEFDVVVSSSYEAMLGAHAEYLDQGLFVRPELFQSIAGFEGQIIRMYERVAIHDLTSVKTPPLPVPKFVDSVDDRAQLFLRQVAFWDHALSLHQIDAVVAQNYGHNGWDAVLQVVAQARGLPYLFFHEVRPFLSTLYVHEHLHQLGSLSLGRDLVNTAKEKGAYVPDSTDRIIRMVGQMGMEPVPSAEASSEKESKHQWLKRRVGNPVLLPLRLLKSFKRRRNNRLSKKDEFGAQSKKPIPDNYVFCELQSQPNATTAIKGWMFPDQRESVAMVAKHLPKGWSLVVKESDRQWSRMYPRRRNFWTQIAAIPKVHVAPHGFSSMSLLADSKALVETSYSTLALQAIHKGIPVVALGHSHITSLKNVHSVENEQELIDALGVVALNNNSKIPANEIEDDLKDLLEETISSTLEGTLSGMPKFDDEPKKSEYVHRLTTNVSLVITVWLAARLPNQCK